MSTAAMTAFLPQMKNGKKIFLISTKGRIAWKMWGIMKCIYEFEASEGLR